MSHFSQTLTDLMESAEPPLRQADLEKLSGVHNSLISRFIKDRRVPDSEQVARLAAAISPDSQKRARLVVAYLRDLAGPSFALAGVDDRHVLIQSTADAVKALGEPEWWETAPVGLVIKLEAVGRVALEKPAVMALLDAWVNQLCPLWKKGEN
jgi:hypothetical protein